MPLNNEKKFRYMIGLSDIFYILHPICILSNLRIISFKIKPEICKFLSTYIISVNYQKNKI